MSLAIERRIGDALSRWVDLVALRPLATLAGIAAMSVALGALAATSLGLENDVDAVFSEDLPHLRLEHEYRERFPVLDDNLLVLVDADTPEEARAAARALAQDLRSAPDVIRSVYLPQDPFFEEHSLLYLSRDDLEEFSDRLARMQPYLAGLAKDGSLRGLADMLQRGLAAVRDGDVDAGELIPMIAHFDRAIRERLAGRDYRASWSEIVAGERLNLGPQLQFVIVDPILDHSQLVPGEKSMARIQAAIDAVDRDVAPSATVRVTGNMALNHEEMNLVRSQAASAGLASFVLVSGFLFWALRSFRMVVGTQLTLIIGLVWTAGFATLTIGHLNVISMAFAVLYIGLGVDFGIHFALRYLELAGTGLSHRASLRETARDTGTSICLCAVTTAIGFLAFVPTDFTAVAELGVIAGGGIFIGVFLCVTMLPALMSLGSQPISSVGKPPRSGEIQGVLSFSARHPEAVVIGACVVAAVALAILPRVDFDHNPLRVRDPAAPSVQALEELLTDGDSSPWDLSIVSDSLEEADALAVRMRELDEVDTAVSLVDFLPADQDEKLSIIEDVALFMAPPVLDGEAAKPSVDEQEASLVGLNGELDKVLRDKSAPELVPAAESLKERMAALLAPQRASTRAADIAAVEKSLLASLPEQLRVLDAAINPNRVTIERLPKGLVERMLSSDGKARVRITPSGNMNDNEELARFVEAVRAVSPDITGSAVRIYEHGRVAVSAFRQALLSAVIVIAILVFLIWRTIGDTLLVLLPLGLASISTAAAAYILGIPFNFANIIVLPLLLGIGVDSGIHLVHRAREPGVGGKHLLETSTAGAVLFSALTTIASFGTLAFASHRGIGSIGALLTVGVSLAVAANLIVLPALVELRAKRQRRA